MQALTAAAARGTPFQVVLLDAQMPDLDGFDVAARVAAEPTLAGTTIMMLTSGGRYGDSTRCRELGIATYLTKPVKQADLFDGICRALDGGDRRAVASRRGADRSPPTRCAAPACCSPRTTSSISAWPSVCSSGADTR